ncbi:MAG: phytoene dehydrogenase-like protein [Myxococcota bacterium]|jgi:phytoene dehydrogenase-like protein
MTNPTVVIGAGVEGLVAAAHLARSGQRVVVVERLQRPGGLCAGEEFHPGYRHVGVWHDASSFAQSVSETLGLERHGLAREERVTPLALGPERGVWLDAKGVAQTGHSEAWNNHHDFLARITPLAHRWLTQTPPVLSTTAALLPLAKRALGLRRLGRADMLSLLRVGPSCVDDFLEESFTDPLIRAGLAVPALHGSWMGPRSPQSTALYLQRHVLRGQDITGGPAALVHALVAACASAGVEIQCDATVDHIEVSKGRARAVVLADGTALRAAHVVSTIGPVETLEGLVHPSHRPVAQADVVRRIRTRGTFAKVHLAVERPLTFRHSAGRDVHSAVVAAHPLDVERSFDDVKYRRLPRVPILDLRVPSQSTTGLCPEGHAVISITTTVGAEQDDGWTADARQALGVRVLETLASVTDLNRDDIAAIQVVTPEDLHTRWGHRGGHPMHGEMALDQIWALRPAPSLAQHHTAIVGLYLGSTGTSPGLPATGLSGMHAAEAVLRA